MASKFGADTTGLEAPDIKSAKFISEGVVDKSGAMMAEAVGGTIMTGLEEYKKGKIDYELEKERVEVEDAIKGFFADPLMGQNVDMLSEQTAGAFTPEEDQALQDAQGRLAQLRNAYNSTGTPISDIELKARVESLTKNYINRFPGLANEFRTVAANELGDYATRVSMIQAQRDAEAKAKATGGVDWEWAMKEAIKAGVFDPTKPREVWFNDLIKYNWDDTVTKATKNHQERGIISKQETVNDPQRWIPYTRTTARSFQARANAIVSGAGGAAQKLASLEALSLEILPEIDSHNPSGTSDPKVTAFHTAISNMKTIYQDIAQGKPQSEASKNQLSMLNNSIELGLLQDPEIGGLIVSNRIFGDVAFADLLKTDQDMQVFYGTMKRVMSGDFPVAQTIRPEDQRQRDVKLTGFMRQLQKAVQVASTPGKKITQEDVISVNLALGALANGMPNEKTPAAYDGVLQLMSSPEWMDYSKNFLDPAVSAKLAQHAETFITDSVVTGFSGLYDSDTMKLQNTTDGRFFVTTSSTDPKVHKSVEQINRDFAPRLSAAARASAHTQGTTNYGDVGGKFSLILEDTSKQQKIARKQAEAQAKAAKGKEVTFLPVPKGEEDTKIRINDWMYNSAKSVVKRKVGGLVEFGTAVVEGPQQ